MARPARRNRPVLFHFLLATGVGLVLALGLWWGLSRQFDWRHLLGFWLVGVNVTALAYYGYDKGQAQSGSNRVPEVVLHWLSASGGSPGAYAAMHLFRHKTIKGKFRILFWCIVVLQVAIAAWILKAVWWS
jgi:uncharacterized membrane protein YsdA (DUF1294 family)